MTTNRYEKYLGKDVTLLCNGTRYATQGANISFSLDGRVIRETEEDLDLENIVFHCTVNSGPLVKPQSLERVNGSISKKDIIGIFTKVQIPK